MQQKTICLLVEDSTFSVFRVQVRILHHLCEVLSVVPRSTGNPLMDLMPVPDNNAWCIVD